ncbi:hypothetical protein DLM78_17835 [Leptospira stimsonii]|uniref:Uncharacterized protein n=1 Tax=Leptospira stimsonii TaxID=2202203 RepID=A0A8B3CPV3_9LEPT|nr:hypothetical protein DLM78_17835 [Leptospira stimsonii]
MKNIGVPTFVDSFCRGRLRFYKDPLLPGISYRNILFPQKNLIFSKEREVGVKIKFRRLTIRRISNS